MKLSIFVKLVMIYLHGSITNRTKRSMKYESSKKINYKDTEVIDN